MLATISEETENTLFNEDEMDEFGLSRLVEKSRQLIAHIDDQTFTLHRNLEQIEQQARAIAQGTGGRRGAEQGAGSRAYALSFGVCLVGFYSDIFGCVLNDFWSDA